MYISTTLNEEERMLLMSENKPSRGPEKKAILIIAVLAVVTIVVVYAMTRNNWSLSALQGKATPAHLAGLFLFKRSTIPAWG